LWALTVAASTKNAFKGALVMILLVLMTLIPLTTVHWGFQRILKNRAKKISLILLSFSLVWTSLVVAAANEWILHNHFLFSFMGREYMLMFW
jgi:sulfite exporter TauE/SafE